MAASGSPDPAGGAVTTADATESDEEHRPPAAPMVADEFDLSDALGDIWSELSGGEHEEEMDAESADEARRGLAGEAHLDESIATTFVEAAEAVGLGSVAEGTAGLEVPVGPEMPPESEEVEPWQRLTAPSPVGGYVNDGERSVLRIQRNKPPGRCTVTCYRHRGCHVLLNLDRTPPDAELYKWLFEVAPATTEHSREEAKALAAEHTSLAKARWSAPVGKAAPTGKAKGKAKAIP